MRFTIRTKSGAVHRGTIQGNSKLNAAELLKYYAFHSTEVVHVVTDSPGSLPYDVFLVGGQVESISYLHATRDPSKEVAEA